jgi:UrcA family protein
MGSKFTRHCFGSGSVAIAGVLLALPAIAQPVTPPPQQPAVVQEITVIAPEVVRPTAGTARFAGSPIEVVSLSRVVSFADLDLSSPAGAATLRQRIRDTADKACAQLESEYPSNIYVPVPANQNCVRRATDTAMSLADQIIAAAGAPK